MKKLLALVLCVMLFVSIIPTAAFADDWQVVGSKSVSGGYYAAKVNKSAIDDLKDAMENMYSSLAANQTVFGTAQALHSMADDLVKGLFADVEDYTALDKTVYDHDDLVTNSRAFLKGIIGAYITDYVTTREAAWKDAAGNIDYEDYLKVYTKGVQNALTSSKAQKGIEAFIYSLAALKMQDAVADAHDDLKDAIIDWNDYGSKWDEFGFGQDIEDLWKVTAPAFGSPIGLTDREYKTLDGILTGAIS